MWFATLHNKGLPLRKWGGAMIEAVLLEIHDDYLVFGNERTKVTESDGRTWRTKEPAVLYFFHKNWYNIIQKHTTVNLTKYKIT